MTRADHDAGLSASDHSSGPQTARVTLLEYGDYECPFCQKAQPEVQRLLDSHHGQLRLVFRHYPLVEQHPHAEDAAEAAEAAAAQGRFWDMHALLFAQKHGLNPEALAGYAQSLGLDMRRFHNELADHVYLQRIHEHRALAQQMQVRAVPAFFVNGRAVDTGAGFAAVQQAVEQALKHQTS